LAAVIVEQVVIRTTNEREKAIAFGSGMILIGG
jgi:hypothetical protein